MDILIHFRTGRWHILQNLSWQLGTGSLDRRNKFVCCRISGGRSAADWLRQAAPALHQHHNFLHWPPLSSPPGLPLSLSRLPVHVAAVSPGEDLQVLGVARPDGEAHQLSQPVPAGLSDALPAGGLSLECLYLLCHSQGHGLRVREQHFVWSGVPRPRQGVQVSPVGIQQILSLVKSVLRKLQWT